MEKLLIKKGCFALGYALTAIITEIISFAVMGMGVAPSFWGIDAAFILGISVLIFVLPWQIPSLVIHAVLLFLQVVLGIVNEALYSMSGTVFSVSMLNLTKEVGNVFTANFVNWWLFAGLLLLYAAELTAMVFVHIKIRVPRVKFSQKIVCLLLVCCLVGENASLLTYRITLGSFRSAVASDELGDYNDDTFLYKSQFLPAKAYKKFGFFGFYFMNVSNMLDSLTGGNSASEGYVLSSLDSYFSSGEMSSSAYGDNIYTGSLNGKNVVLIVIESGEWYAINKEYTPTLYAMASGGISFTEYYARDKTNHSEALSVLGSYPVQSDPATTLKNSDLSFTLPRLLDEIGYTSNYFHANTASFYERETTYGPGGVYGFDTAHFLDDMPALDGCDADGNVIKDSFYEFDKDAKIAQNYFPEYTYKKDGDGRFFTMQMTLSSHGHYEELIERGNYPFDPEDPYSQRYYTDDMTAAEKAARQEQLKAEFSEDCTLKGFEQYYEIIDSYPETFVCGKGISLDTTADSPYSAELLREIYLRYKRFQAGMMDLDREVNSLVYDLQRTGQLDDTAFIFYADHTAYYNNLNCYMKGVETGESWNTALYNIPCFLWYGGSMDCDVTVGEDWYEDEEYPYREISFRASKDTDSPLVGGREIDKFVCSFDILPTILQLVGYDYNLNLYQGVSAFSDRTSVFISRESGIFTDKIYYDGITVSVKGDDGKWTQYDYEGTLYSEEGFTDEVTAFLKDSINYYKKQEMLEEMYRLDYFSYRPIFGDASYEGRNFRYMVKP